MPRTIEDPQAQKEIESAQAACEAEHLAIVDWTQWVSACRVKAIREYLRNQQLADENKCQD